MNKKNNFLLKSSIGFSLGIVIGIVITAITGTLSANDGTVYLYNTVFAQRIGNLYFSIAIEMLCYGLLGFVGMGIMALTYDNDEMPLVKATFLHFVAVMLVFCLVGFTLGWLDPTDLVANVIFVTCFIFAYVMIWVIMSLIYKKEVRSINNNLKKLQRQASDV